MKKYKNIKHFIVPTQVVVSVPKKVKKYEDLEKAFAKKKLHPLDLKNSCAEYLIKICGEIRKNY